MEEAQRQATRPGHIPIVRVEKASSIAREQRVSQKKKSLRALGTFPATESVLRIPGVNTCTTTNPRLGLALRPSPLVPVSHPPFNHLALHLSPPPLSSINAYMPPLPSYLQLSPPKHLGLVRVGGHLVHEDGHVVLRLEVQSVLDLRSLIPCRTGYEYVDGAERRQRRGTPNVPVDRQLRWALRENRLAG